MPQLQCTNLTIGYENLIVTKNLNFEVNKGDYLCILGHNGSGKSTLMKTLLGLLKPLSGSISTGEGLSFNKIGYLPQQTVVQKDFPASVWEVVLSGCQAQCGFRPFYNAKEKQLAQSNIEKMQLTELKNRCFRELSGGQQQRVLLARALCATKQMLLLDEPVSGLDPKVTREMYETIRRLNKEDGITIIMISHDISSALTYASHILYVDDEPFFGKREDFEKSDYLKALTSAKEENA